METLPNNFADFPPGSSWLDAESNSRRMRRRVAAAWVGIGGVRSRDLIQAGTQRIVLDNGATQDEAWLELLPRAPETVPLKLGPANTIRVSIDQQGPELWLIAFNNITSGQTYQVTKHYASSLTS